jgi:hypothetical protein
MAWDSTHGKWCLLLCATALLYNAVSAVGTGCIPIFHIWAARTDHEYPYWFGVFGCAVLRVTFVVIVTLGK